jgi:hypothetical protein
MSQSIRRVLAVTGLAAAFLLSVPAPSRAAGLRGQAPAARLSSQDQARVTKLAASSGPVVSTQQPVIQRKDTPLLSPPPIPPSSTTGSGSMIDPDGIKH